MVEGKTQLALVKDVQVHPVRRDILHADFLAVKAGEKVDVEVPVVVVGEPFAGTIANLDNATVLLEVEATHIPQNIEVDVEGLEEGTHITAAELSLPRGASLAIEPDVLVVAISVPAGAAADEAEEGAESAEAESAGE